MEKLIKKKNNIEIKKTMTVGQKSNYLMIL